MLLALEPARQPEVIALIDALDAHQKPLYPPESHYGIDLDALSRPNVLFAVVRNAQAAAVGCGAVVLQPEYGEIKRMFVRPEHRGQGIALQLMDFLEREAGKHGCTRFMLETGVHQPEALALYARAGYRRRARFGAYPDDPLSVFMEKHISETASAPTSPLHLHLVWPSHAYLPGYAAALARGWSPNTMRPEAAQEELAQIRSDADGFLAGLVDREARGAPITLPDGSTVPRLPGYRRWLWDGEFCGSISLRWQRGSNTLPDFCPGHIGYAVVPWKSGRGYATQALRALLPEAAAEGLDYVEVTTSPANLASQRVIRANGGVLVEEYTKLPELGGTPELRFRIDLPGR